MSIYLKKRLKILFKKISHLLKLRTKIKNKIKFQLPNIDLLKIPTKKERENSNKNESHDSEFLEKILLDFGVNGIKK